MDHNMRICIVYIMYNVFNEPDITKLFWRRKMSKCMWLCRLWPIIFYISSLYWVFEEQFPILVIWMHVNEITSHSFIINGANKWKNSYTKMKKGPFSIYYDHQWTEKRSTTHFKKERKKLAISLCEKPFFLVFVL